jgi:peptidoglycan hydrolase-like protein with peptidoglycan-binding domain
MSLRIGSQGSAVAQVKERLRQEGARLDPNAVYGVGTANAVKKFQKEHNLDPDGVVGPKTAAAMGLGGDAFEPGNGKSTPASRGGNKLPPKPPSSPGKAEAPVVPPPPVQPDAVAALRSLTRVVERAANAASEAKANGTPLTAEQRAAIKKVLETADQVSAENNHLILETSGFGEELNRLRVALGNLEKALE